jgi:hypothetical protein
MRGTGSATCTRGRRPSLMSVKLLAGMARWFGAVLLLVCWACTSTQATSSPSEGSGSPFASGSTKGSVQGSDDFALSQAIRYESGAIHGTLTYTGTCNLVKAELRFSYVKNGQTLTDKEADGVLRGYDIGPLAPNHPYDGNYPGEHKFTPDAVVFVISNERCA